MPHGVQWRRLGMYIVFLLLVCAMMWIVMQGALAWRTHREITTEFQQQFAPWYVRQRITIMQNRLDRLDQEADTPFGRRSIDEERAELQELIDALEASELEEVISIPRPSDAMWEAITTPWREDSKLALSVSDYAQWYPGPRQLLYQYANPWLIADASETWLMLRSLIGVMWTISVLMPASFIFLPITRRRAKVQWRHVGRVAVYGLSIPCATTAAAFGLMIATNTLPNPFGPGFGGGNIFAWYAAAAIAILPLPMIVLWWWMAMRHYLKMPHALCVSIMMASLCLLLMLLTVTYVSFARF